MILLALTSSGESVPFTTDDLVSCPHLSRWLSIWAPDSAGLSAAAFRRGSSGSFAIPDSEWTALAMTPTPCVVSPDSSYAIWTSTPGDEPDSEVDLIDVRGARRTRLLTSGTPGDYEMAWWLSPDVALIAGGHWDPVTPVLIRFNLSTHTCDYFRGPSLAPDRARGIQGAVQALWAERFPSQR